MSKLEYVMFDLDGTLLPMDQEEFVRYYMPRLAKRFVKYGIEMKSLIGIIWKGVEAMVRNDGSRSNEEAFWSCFEELTGIAPSKVEETTMDFYRNEFNDAIAATQPNPLANEIIQFLKNKGIKVYLATNPIFPRVATMNRIRWAGLQAEDFEEITTYENYHYCKPNPKYFSELMERYGLDPEKGLMVGNDVLEDLTIRSLGVKTFLLTDTLENKKKIPLDEVETDYMGSMESLRAWLEENC